jgi:integrase
MSLREISWKPHLAASALVPGRVFHSAWPPKRARNRIQGDKLFLYTAKTGTAVYCPLPPIVVRALNAIPASKYYFWTGLSKPKSAVGDLQRTLKRLFRLAGVPDAHAHRLRDTFSEELLLADVPTERVSVLRGHQSVRITEKHYAPWVRARQEQLESDVRLYGAHGQWRNRQKRYIRGTRQNRRE